MKNAISLRQLSCSAIGLRKDLLNESLYSRTASFFHVHLDRLDESLPSWHLLDRPLFSNWSAGDAMEVSMLIGCTPDEFSSLSGQDLKGTGAFGLALCEDVRYCPQCLKLGYHSITYQHLAVSHCELHAQRLVQGCPHCSSPIVPTIRNARNFPWYCPQCECSLLGVDVNESGSNFFSDAALSQGRGFLARSATEVKNIHHINSSLNQYRRVTATESRYIRRAVVFYDAGEFCSQQFDEMQFPVFQDRDSDSQEVLASGVAITLKWLSENCPFSDEACRLAERLGHDPGGCAINLQCSAIAALLCKTLYCYGLMQDFRRIHLGEVQQLSRRTRESGFKRFTQEILVCPATDVRLLQLEIIGLFGILLASFRRGTSLTALDWNDIPAPISYVPSWISRRDKANGVVIHMRARLDEMGLKRLFGRYFASMFVLEPLPGQNYNHVRQRPLGLRWLSA